MESQGSQAIDALLQKEYSVKIGDYLTRGWELFKRNIGGFIAFTLIVIVIQLILSVLNRKGVQVGSLISLIIAGPLSAGFLIVAFKLIRNRVTNFEDFFRGFSNFLPLFLVYLLTNILVGIGMIFLIIPGIYLAVAYLFSMAFVVERRLNFWDAMETSRKLITKRWFSFFGLVLLLGLINLVGALLLGLGLLVTIPVSFCTIAAAYDDIVGVSASSVDL